MKWSEMAVAPNLKSIFAQDPTHNERKVNTSQNIGVLFKSSSAPVPVPVAHARLLSRPSARFSRKASAISRLTPAALNIFRAL